MESTARQQNSQITTSVETDYITQIYTNYVRDSIARKQADERFEKSLDQNISTIHSTSKEIDPVFNFDEICILPTEKKRVVFQAMQEWEGCVVEIFDDYFTAQLIDLTANEDIATEEADFSIEEVSNNDLELIKPGNIFRWSIGYQTSPSGTKRRISQIVFRRLPAWTKSSFEKSEALASELELSINWK